MSESTPPPGLDATPEANGSKSDGTFSLENILGENHDTVEHPGTEHTQAATGWDEEETEKPLAEGYCVECEGLSQKYFSFQTRMAHPRIIHTRPTFGGALRNVCGCIL